MLKISFHEYKIDLIKRVVIKSMSATVVIKDSAYNTADLRIHKQLHVLHEATSDPVTMYAKKIAFWQSQYPDHIPLNSREPAHFARQVMVSNALSNIREEINTKFDVSMQNMIYNKVGEYITY